MHRQNTTNARFDRMALRYLTQFNYTTPAGSRIVCQDQLSQDVTIQHEVLKTPLQREKK